MPPPPTAPTSVPGFPAGHERPQSPMSGASSGTPIPSESFTRKPARGRSYRSRPANPARRPVTILNRLLRALRRTRGSGHLAGAVAAGGRSATKLILLAHLPSAEGRPRAVCSCDGHIGAGRLTRGTVGNEHRGREVIGVGPPGLDVSNRRLVNHRCRRSPPRGPQVERQNHDHGEDCRCQAHYPSPRWSLLGVFGHDGLLTSAPPPPKRCSSRPNPHHTSYAPYVTAHCIPPASTPQTRNNHLSRAFFRQDRWKTNELIDHSRDLATLINEQGVNTRVDVGSKSRVLCRPPCSQRAKREALHSLATW
jgi:hypothetical protein